MNHYFAMFAELWDKDALQRSMTKDREDDGFDHIRANMDTAYNIGKTALQGVRQVADLYNDFTDAADSVNRSTSKRARTSSEPGLSIDKNGTKVQKVVQTTPVGHSNLAQVQSGIGSSGTQVVGNNTAPPIQLKLGKQLGTTNSIANFLSLMNASGSVSVAFGGRLEAPQDKRVRSYQAFRHNLHGDGGTGLDGAAYPVGSLIMTPSGNLNANFTGGNPHTATLLNSQIRDITDGSIHFSFYNKPDLEDVSFNLNKFKLGPQRDTTNTVAPYATVGGPDPTVQLLNDVPTLDKDSHRAFSAIYWNNSRALSVPIASSGSNYSCAPYQYDAVFKQGTVDYMFMNKGESPCEVELIVYRVKKNGTQGVPSKFSDLRIDLQLEDPITEGMMKKTLGYVGTDLPNDAGNAAHTPVASDWIKDPSRPFLPKSRFIEQSTTPYVEENRVKLTLQSGQRRPFQLKLGGIKYDPTRHTLNRKYGFADPPKLMPIFDEHSYIVCIAVNGIAMSRQLGGVTSAALQLTSGPIIGDVYGPADLQWYGQYTEHVGAMAYKRVHQRNVFTYGAAPPMRAAIADHNAGVPASSQISSTPVALLTQAQAVRIPQTPTQTQSSTGFSISTQSSNVATGGATV